MLAMGWSMGARVVRKVFVAVLVVGVTVGMPCVAQAVDAAPRSAAAAGRPSPVDGQPPAVAPGAKTGVLVSQRASLTGANRPSGFPTDPALAIARAEVKVEPVGSPASYHITGSTVTLAGDVPQTASVELGLGNLSGTTCGVDQWFSAVVAPSAPRTTTFYGYSAPRTRPWDCVVARTVSADEPGTDYDVLIGPLISTYASPALRVGKPTLLGVRQKKLRLVRGVPTTIEVPVRNTGPVAARDVVVRAKGRHLKVKKTTIASVAAHESGTAALTVRLKGKKKPGRLTITATSGGASARRAVAVRAVKPPKRPKAGKYRNKAGTVRFTVRKGKVVGWNGYMQTRCGGYPSLPTYTMNTYDFHTVKIPRNGLVQARQRGTGYGAQLQMKVVGGKVTDGLFRYEGPARCSAMISFTAKRR